MAIQRISGSVSADGTPSSADFTVAAEPARPAFEGRRIWRVTVTSLTTLDGVEELRETESRDGQLNPDGPPGPAPFAVVGIIEINPTVSTFVVVAGYTRLNPNPGHGGFSFVAVGDGSG